MPAVSRYAPWTQQPQGPLVIDWSNPLARSLRFAIVGSSPFPRDLVSGKAPSLNGAATSFPVPGRYGIGARHNGGFLDYGRTGADEIVSGSVFWIAQSTDTFPTIFFGSGENLINGSGFQVGLDNTRLVNHGFFLQGNNADQGNSGFNALTDFRQPEPAAFTWDGTTIRAYSKGVLRNSTSSSFTATANSNRITRLQARDTAAGNAPTAAMQLVLAWDRVLSAQEIAWLTARPWTLFAPMTRKLYFAAAPSGIPALSAAAAIDITSTSARPRVTITF